MQANAANEHSQMLAQVPANVCSDSESRKCSLVLLLVPYSTLARKVFRLRNTARARAQTGSGSREHSINMTNKLDYSNKCVTSRENH